MMNVQRRAARDSAGGTCAAALNRVRPRLGLLRGRAIQRELAMFTMHERAEARDALLRAAMPATAASWAAPLAIRIQLARDRREPLTSPELHPKVARSF